MAMQIGDDQASSGMTKDIYEQIDQIMKSTIPSGSLDEARKAWKKLAFAVASGVITHIKNNIEISAIQAQGSVSTTVVGTVSGSSVTGTGTGSVNTNQTGSQTGHVS